MNISRLSELSIGKHSVLEYLEHRHLDLLVLVLVLYQRDLWKDLQTSRWPKQFYRTMLDDKASSNTCSRQEQKQKQKTDRATRLIAAKTLRRLLCCGIWATYGVRIPLRHDHVWRRRHGHGMKGGTLVAMAAPQVKGVIPHGSVGEQVFQNCDCLYCCLWQMIVFWASMLGTSQALSPSRGASACTSAHAFSVCQAFWNCVMDK